MIDGVGKLIVYGTPSVTKAKKAYAKQQRDRAKTQERWVKAIQREIQDGIIGSAERGRFDTTMGRYDNEDVANEVAQIARDLGYTAKQDTVGGIVPRWIVHVSWKLIVAADLPKATLRAPRKWYQFWK